MEGTGGGSIQRSGLTLRWKAEGSGIDALVLGSSIFYPRTFSGALRRQFRMVFADCRHFAAGDGFGARVDDVGIDDYCDDIERVRFAAGIQGRALIIGHSHHGNLALAYAKRFPGSVDRIVLIGSPPAGVRETLAAAEDYWSSNASMERNEILRRNRERLALRTASPTDPEAAWMAAYVADGPRYWYDPEYDAGWLWKDVPVRLALIDRFRSFFERSPDFPGVPVLVVMGRHDYAVPPLLWNPVLPRLTGVTLKIFERSGHTPQLEEPDHFESVLQEWLNGGG